MLNYVKDSLSCTPLLSYSNGVCEILIIKIQQKNCVVCTIYRPPSSKSVDFTPILEKLQACLTDHKNCDIIIAGDLNFPHVDWADPLCRKTSTTTNDVQLQLNKLLNLTDDYFLNQLITEPTRDGNTLDLVFTNITDDLLDCNLTEYKSMSDHKLIELKLKNLNNSTENEEEPQESNEQNSEYKHFNFHKADYNLINTELSQINWVSELKDCSVKDQLSKFHEIVLNAVSKHTSKKLIHNNKVYRSKFYKERRALWRLRKRIYNKQILNNCRCKQLEEIELKIKKSHQAEHSHNETIAVDKISSNIKYFYSYANKSKKSRDKVGPFINKETEETITDPAEIAETLQTQYCSVFSTPSRQEEIENIEDFFKEDGDEPTLSDISFTKDDIVTAIKQIKPHAAAGPDGFPAMLLRECCHEISNPLYIIFRNSIDTGEVPNELKDAIITPIPKGGLKSDPKNYRPINLISQLLKTLEKVLCVQIVSFLEIHNKMNRNQHGFRKLRSCLSQLIEHYDNVIEAVSQGNNIDVIYLDYSKAFDVVDHHILLRKLKSSGITGKIGFWISNLISNRKQTVAVNHGVYQSLKLIFADFSLTSR